MAEPNPYFIFEITARCNSNCLYCYNVWRENRDYPRGELSLERIKKLFKKILAETTPAGLTLAGGEPVMRPDIFEIISFFQKNKIQTGLASNGTLLDENNIGRLVKSGVNYFEISLSSLNQETYSVLSQNDKMEKIRSAILLIKKYRIPLTVSFIITKLNFSELEKVFDLCSAFSVNSLALNRFIPGGRGFKNRGKLEINRKELESVLKIANRKSAEYNLPVNITLPVESCVIRRQNYPRLNFGACVCGKYKWVIDPLGNLRTCEQNPRILGNLFKNSFLELSAKKEVGNFLSANAYKKCGACPDFAFCGGGCRFLKQKKGLDADKTT